MIFLFALWLVWREFGFEAAFLFSLCSLVYVALMYGDRRGG